MAKNPGRQCFVAGSIGPGTKAVTLGHIDYETLLDSYAEQVRGLIDGGLVRARIDLGQNVARLDFAAFVESDFDQLTVDLGPHQGLLVRLNIAKSRQDQRHVLPGGRRHANRHRRRSHGRRGRGNRRAEPAIQQECRSRQPDYRDNLQ